MVYLKEKSCIAADLKARLDAKLQVGTTGLVIAALTADFAGAAARGHGLTSQIWTIVLSRPRLCI